MAAASLDPIGLGAPGRFLVPDFTRAIAFLCHAAGKSVSNVGEDLLSALHFVLAVCSPTIFSIPQPLAKTWHKWSVDGPKHMLEVWFNKLARYRIYIDHNRTLVI